jgi:hypothetical protein
VDFLLAAEVVEHMDHQMIQDQEELGEVDQVVLLMQVEQMEHNILEVELVEVVELQDQLPKVWVVMGVLE